MRKSKLNRFYTHIHIPTKDVKFGVTGQSLSERIVYECNNFGRNVNDYKIIHDIETSDCWKIERDCIRMLSEKYSMYKIPLNNGKKLYQERFRYHRPIMRKIDFIVKSYEKEQK